MINNALKIPLSELIAPSFYEVHKDIKRHKHTHYKLSGGRGSTKSSFVGSEIVVGMMRNPRANAICFRKVATTLQDSVYAQLLWVIDKLQVNHLWHASLAPLKLTYLPTGQVILFRGLDEPRKSKSIKARKGYFKYVWFEERDELDGADQERTVTQSLLRGGTDHIVFYTWNPPKSINSWVNQDVLIPREDTLVHHSTYLTVSKEWLGETFLLEAEALKKSNPRSYEHEYMGVAIGTGGKVFDNVTTREITSEEIERFDHIHHGLDFGFAADPLAYVKNHFDSKRRKLYIFAEIYQVQLSNAKAVAKIKAFNPLNQCVIADSEDPRTINEFSELGLNITGAKKGPGSVDHGMKWLQDLNEIIIDPIKCPNATREFTSYELERDRNGNFKGSYPDKDNHTIDAIRYSLESKMTYKKARVGKRSSIGM